MKNGKLEPTRLSERLNAELDAIRQASAASMASQLENFRQDLETIATDARDIIENDTRRIMEWNARVLSNRLSESLRWITIAPWAMAATAALFLATSVVLSWIWSREIGARLERKSAPIGQSIELEGISYLLLPPGQIEPTHCTINGEKLPCLRRKER